ncbi:MAG: MFS transporter [Thermoproteota archaeon]
MARAFIISYLTYAAYYLTRLNISVALPSMAIELGYPKATWGVMGGLFSAAYGVGQIVNGRLAERMDARKVMTTGLVLSAVSNAIFGIAGTAEAMIVLWAVNGYAQSTGWPSVVKVVSEFIGRGSKGKAGGVFGTCFLVGSASSLLFSGYVSSRFGWRAAFIFPPALALLFAVLYNLGLGGLKTDQSGKERDSRRQPARGMSVFTTEVAAVTAAYVLLQFVRSWFGLWAPAYIFEIRGVALDYASYGAAVIPMGGMAGAVLSGWVLDRFGARRRTPAIFAMTASLGVVLLALRSSTDFMASGILLFFGGLTLYGPHVVISTIFPMEFGGRHGAANLAGFIDGLGYLGTTFADPFVGWIIDSGGWEAATSFWTASSFGAASLMYFLWRAERGKARASSPAENPHVRN